MMVELLVFLGGVAAANWVRGRILQVNWRQPPYRQPMISAHGAPHIHTTPYLDAAAEADDFAGPATGYGTAPRFAVEDRDGVPDLDQFRGAVPGQAARYPFTYANQYGHAFAFEAVRQRTASYEVLIHDQPEYGHGQDAGSHATHRLGLGTANACICFASGVEPYDLPDACRKAVLWADLTSRYILFNERFG